MSGPPVLMAILVAFFYLVPAVMIHLLSGSLANPRREAWQPPPEAEDWKRRYRRGAFLGQQLNLLLLGVFFVHVLVGLIYKAYGCDATVDHLAAAAYNMAIVIDRVFVVGLVVLAGFALAGIVWSILYFARARRSGWNDPRRRDAMIVHVGLMPIAIFLMFVAFSALLRTLCPPT